MINQPKFNVPPVGERWPFTWVLIDDLIISLTQEGPIPDPIWDRFMADAASEAVKHHFGCAIGNVSINSVQRKSVVEALVGVTNTTVIESTIARGIVTAVSWLGMSIKSFPWKEFDRAVERVESKSVTHAEVKQLAEKLLKQSGAPSLAKMMGG